MKTWVKVWLFALNGVFLAAFAFRHDPLAWWALTAYAASGPLLLAIAWRQRGLTRLLGIAHLVPWLPLVAYLLARVTTSAAGERITASSDPTLFGYVVVLLATVGVCLALDVLDVARWLWGERYVLGSDEAYRAGASFRTLADES
jgi:hypothetical protein